MSEDEMIENESVETEATDNKFFELRGLFTNAIAWAFWGGDEETVIDIPTEKVDLARKAAERCIKDLNGWNEVKQADSPLVQHAKRELELIGEEQETIDWYLEVIQAFVSYGHSGGSASVTIPTINELLQFKNLSPLTNNPHEWIQVAEKQWQNVRNPEAFSDDGGVTHYLLSDPHVNISGVWLRVSTPTAEATTM